MSKKMSKVNELSVLVLLIYISLCNTLDLCNFTSLIENNVTSYYYESELIQDCNTCGFECIRKCCASGFYVNNSVCQLNSEKELVIPVFKHESLVYELNNFSKNVMVDIMNCSFYALTPSLNPNDKFFVQNDGNIWVPHLSKNFSNAVYCVDDIDSNGLSAFICFDDNDDVDPTTKRFNMSGMIISMPFLLATFVVYAILPERNLHMKALMFYVLCLLTGYICLVTIQLMPVKLEPGPCKTLGFVCIFSFILSFLWMNVICIDIWFTFSGFRAFSRSHKAERRRFIMYCAYSWGLAFIHFLVVFLINEFNTDNVWYSPKIGESMCFIQSGWPELFYFYGPMAVIIIVNITLFASTAWKIVKIKRDTSMLKKNDSKRHTYENDKQKFNLYLKLFLAMGVNWTMEVISWAVEWMIPDVKYVWIATDFCNAMYGVFIFFIFVFKKSTWKILKKRYYSFVGKPHLAHSMTTSSQTRTRDSECTTTEIALSETAVPREEMSLTKNHY